MAQRKIGTISHYYDGIGVAVVDLTSKLSVSDEIKIVGKKGEFTQTVESMEVDHKKVQSGKKGDSLGLKVDQEVNKSDTVYKVT